MSRLGGEGALRRCGRAASRAVLRAVQEARTGPPSKRVQSTPCCNHSHARTPVPLHKRSVVVEQAAGGGGGEDRHRGRGPHRRAGAGAGRLLLLLNPRVCRLCHRCVQPAGLPSTARQTGRVAAAMTVGAGSGLAAAAAAGGWLMAGPRGSRGAAHHRGGHAAAPGRPGERLGASGSGRSSGSELQSTELTTDVAWRRPLESGSASTWSWPA